MATRGFEFAYDLNGASTPLIKDFTLGEGDAYKVGDLCLIQSDGYIDKVAGSIGEVTGVCMEAVSSAAATAGSTKAKFAVITPTQVWRCSTDASTATTAIVGYTKTWDTVDANTIDADDITNGSMIVFDTGTDDDGNVLGYVIFSDTTFGIQDTDTT
jgi:hypothetical protein